MRSDPQRWEAKAKGLKRYFNGKPCKWGHVSERLTSCGRCFECHKAKKAKLRKIKQLAHKIRVEKFGYDPMDLRCRRKERGIVHPSGRIDLVRLRLKRAMYGRQDRKPKGLEQPKNRNSEELR